MGKPMVKVACPSCRQKLDLTDLEPFSRVECPSCQGEIIVPKGFGNLMLEERLGDDSDGAVAVYRALDLTLDREVVVKVLERDSESLGDEFLWIARRSAAINHPGVVPIYSCGLQDDMPFLVCQFMALGNLHHQFQDRPPEEDEIRQVMDWSRMVAAGLHAAQSHEEIHGSVTPSSILLDTDGNAKVGDFGMLPLLTRDNSADPAFVKALPYLSPERLRGEEPTGASDVFGLGVITYRLLTGRLPVAPASDCEEMLSHWQEQAPPTAPAELVPAVPEDISKLCLSMIEVVPAERPSDLSAVAQIFATACKTRMNSKADTQRRARAVRIRAPVARRLEEVRQEAAAASKASGSRMVNILLLACLVLLLTLILVVGLRKAGFFGSTNGQGNAVADRDAVGERGADTSRPEDGVSDDDRARSSAYRRRLEASRLATWAPQRPKPADLDFLRTKEQLARYLESIPSDLVPNERERIRYVSTTRDYLIRLMRYIPYNYGKPSAIRLRGGRSVNGAIPYCNEQELALRGTEGEPMRKFAWGDLAFEQIASFLEFYIKQRLEQGEEHDEKPSANQSREVAEDCLRAAVLCDWYDRAELSRDFARRAVKYNRATATTIERLLPHLGPQS